MLSTTQIRPGLSELVAALRPCLHADPERASAEVATVLRANPPRVELLSAGERAGRADRPASVLLHAEPGLSLVGLAWRPGQFTAVHDHLSWCVVQVAQGREHETIYRTDGDRLITVREDINPRGSVTALAPPGDIHRVVNSDDEVAISFHVYGADLHGRASSVRRVYDLPID